jgi:DNA polymerase III epsilon subunit-like protein
MPRVHRPEVLVSVDIEASGPTPATGSLLSIGACCVNDPEQRFYRELHPLPDRPWDRGAERIHGLSEARLREQGLPPAQAMTDFVDWVDQVAGHARPVFVGFNAVFDWMFVAEYLARFVGRNPFGHSALDLKSLYMGREGVERWADTEKVRIAERYPVEPQHTHHALDDALMQAALARALLAPRP